MGKGWSKGGNRQRTPTFTLGKRYKGWAKDGQKAGKASEKPNNKQEVAEELGKEEKIRPFPLDNIK